MLITQSKIWPLSLSLHLSYHVTFSLCVCRAGLHDVKVYALYVFDLAWMLPFNSLPEACCYSVQSCSFVLQLISNGFWRFQCSFLFWIALFINVVVNTTLSSYFSVSSALNLIVYGHEVTLLLLLCCLGISLHTTSIMNGAPCGPR